MCYMQHNQHKYISIDVRNCSNNDRQQANNGKYMTKDTRKKKKHKTNLMKPQNNRKQYMFQYKTNRNIC